MAEVEIVFPSVPEKGSTDDLVYAVGRLALGWSASEYYLALLLTRLAPSRIASVNISGNEPHEATLEADTNAIFSLFFSIGSSYGRRKAARELVQTRQAEGTISTEWKVELVSLLEQHEQLAPVRNKYLHTPISSTLDGAPVMLNREMMISRNNRSRKMTNPSVRAGNNKPKVSEINETCEKIKTWIDRAVALIRELESRAPGD